MSEYRHTVSRTQIGGFAQSPEQSTGNSASPRLDQPLSLRDAATKGVAYMYGKRVVSVGLKAIISQQGNSKLEEGIAIGAKIGGYLLIAAYATPQTALAAAAAEGITTVITNTVETHAITLDNERKAQERGTRINFGAGGYYG